MTFYFKKMSAWLTGLAMLMLSTAFAHAQCVVVPNDRTTTLQTSGLYRIYAYNIGNPASVFFPTWAETNNQGDLAWYPGVNAGNGIWYADINLAMHNQNNPLYGNFITHVYTRDAQGTLTLCGTTTWQRRQATGPASCNSLRTNTANTNEVKTSNGYLRIYANGVTNAAGMLFPTWSQMGGQDDIVWYRGTYDRTESDGTETWHADINLELHKANNPQYGEFLTHAYVENPNGALALCSGISYTVSPPVCNESSPEAPVYIIAGQSNALGLGLISELQATDLPMDYAFSMNFPDRSLSGAFDNSLRLSRWAYGAEAINASNYSGNRANYFGPEVSIARTLRNRGIENFYIFKAAVGGSSLAPFPESWPSRGLRSWLSKGEHGIYDSFISEITMANEEICRSGRKPVIKALYWMQGESDALIMELAQQYSTNIKKFIDQITNEKILNGNFPIFIGKIRDLSEINQSLGLPSSMVRNAQQSLNGYLGRVKVFDTQDLSVYPTDKIHYDTRGQIELGNRFINQ